MSPAGAGGERAAAGLPQIEFARGFHSHGGAGGAGFADGRSFDRLFELLGAALFGQDSPRDGRHRAAALDRQITHTRQRAELLDQFRTRTRGDLDALNELSRLIAPPAWTNAILLARDTVRITGEAPEAAPLLKILDSSPLFANSAPDFINKSNTGSGGETFQIHAAREGAK